MVVILGMVQKVGFSTLEKKTTPTNSPLNQPGDIM